MRRICLLVVVSTSLIGLHAQSFQVKPVKSQLPHQDKIANFHNLESTHIEMADVDGDGDLDIIWSGLGEKSFDRRTTIFLNDGEGSYLEKPGVHMPGLFNGDMAIADIDSDGDVDILFIGGITGTVGPNARFFLNDGNGNFHESQDNTVTNLGSAVAEFGDLNGDGYVDLVVQGNGSQTVLYWNNGSGSFPSADVHMFTDVTGGHIRMADVDGDQDIDVLISGRTSPPGPDEVSLYINNGAGSFTKSNNMPYSGYSIDDMEFADINGDGFVDILFVDTDTSNCLFMNDGSGGFTSIGGGGLSAYKGDIEVFDYDNDGDLDILFSGRVALYNRHTTLYVNDGNANFTENPQPKMFRLNDNIVRSGDIDNDGDIDLLLTGTSLGMLYSNDGGEFYPLNGNYLQGYYEGSITVGDINDDDVEDIFISGYTDNSFIGGIPDSLRLQVYLGDTAGTFSVLPGFPIDELYRGEIALGDVDSDGDLDVLVTGHDHTTDISRLYSNNGDSTFTFKQMFTGLSHAGLAFEDFDMDGDQDLVLAGLSNYYGLAKFYKNDGSGLYNQVADPFEDFSEPVLISGDFNSDSIPDVVICGDWAPGYCDLYTGSSLAGFTRIYRGNLAQPITSIAKADFDMNGTLDFVVGSKSQNGNALYFYFNDGNGQFTRVASTDFPDIKVSDIEVADFNEDGAPDLVIQGKDNAYTEVFINDSTGNFSLYEDKGALLPVQGGDIEILDFNIDGRPDLIITGLTGPAEMPSTRLYQTINCESSVFYDTLESCNEFILPWSGEKVKSSGVYKDTLRSVFGCDSFYVVDLTIIPVKLGVTVAGDTLISSALDADAYQWLNCRNDYAPIQGQTHRKYVPSDTGMYAVEVTNGPCVDTSACFGFGVLGVLEDRQVNSDVHIFPNPWQEIIIVQLDEDHRYELLTITDVRGATVAEINIAGNQEVVLSQNFETGVYFFKLNGGGTLGQTIKVVKY